ncbi:MAG: PilZ domain-containing protein [Candidatus Aminicenantes bacterium]|nr:MAG: PilZ domain-containing protein [Candidatus Aminicenantes bacterium]
MSGKGKDEEKREFVRFDCVLPAEIKELKGKKNLIGRATVKDFSNIGVKLTINFNLDPKSRMDLKVYLPEKKLTTSLSGEITWSKFADKKLEIGLKIREMDKKLKKEILEWISPGWIEHKEEKKKKK